LELEEWLQVYQALVVAASAKERSYWEVFIGFLIANCLLVGALVFLFLAYSLPEKLALQTGLGALGLFTSLGWWGSQRRLVREVLVWTSLLRSLEGEFAGAEFYRSLFKVSRGDQVCIPASDWKCNQWHPLVTEFPRLSWGFSYYLAAILPPLFALGWAVLIAASWLV
jgi:hypothetical protein